MNFFYPTEANAGGRARRNALQAEARDGPLLVDPVDGQAHLGVDGRTDLPLGLGPGVELRHAGVPSMERGQLR